MNFDSEQILELLKSGNPHFRKIGEKTLVDDFHIHSHLFFDCFLQSDYNNNWIRYVCQRFPMFIDGFGKPIPFNSTKGYLYFAEYAGEYRLFLDKLNDYVSNIQAEEDKQRLLINLYKAFEGLRVDLEKTYPVYNYPIDSQNNEGKQLMIFITGKCNLQCSYCFSHELESTEMSLFDFEEILQWASANRIVRISLCGGEPTLHSQFDKILALIVQYGFKTYFATNFTIDCTSFQYFNSRVIDKIFIHLTDKVIENPFLRNCLYKNIRHAKEQGIELMFRTNIADKTPKIDKWFQIINETNLPVLNIALTFPTQHLKNQFINIDLFEEYTGIIRKIMDESNKSQVTLSFAKPVPLCIFDQQTQRYLLSRGNFRPICGIHYQNYANNVCVSTEMNFHPCLGVTNNSLPFRKDISWFEVEDTCKKIVKPLLEKPLFAKCTSCFLFDRKLCQGACLSYKTMKCNNTQTGYE